MIDHRHALLLGRDDLRMVPNTYRPDGRWRDLTVAERDAAMRCTGVMAYPIPRRILNRWRFVLYAAIVMACVAVILAVTR